MPALSVPPGRLARGGRRNSISAAPPRPRRTTPATPTSGASPRSAGPGLWHAPRRLRRRSRARHRCRRLAARARRQARRGTSLLGTSANTDPNGHGTAMAASSRRIRTTAAASRASAMPASMSCRSPPRRDASVATATSSRVSSGQPITAPNVALMASRPPAIHRPPGRRRLRLVEGRHHRRRHRNDRILLPGVPGGDRGVAGVSPTRPNDG